MRDVIVEIDAVTLQARLGDLEQIRALSYVAVAEIDQEIKGAPIDTSSQTISPMDGAPGTRTRSM